MSAQATKPSAKTERRGDERTQVLWVASLTSADQTVDCVVLNITNFGAKLRLLDPLPNDTPLTLLIPSFIFNQDRAYRCDLVWQRDNIVGVRFLET